MIYLSVVFFCISTCKISAVLRNECWMKTTWRTDRHTDRQSEGRTDRQKQSNRGQCLRHCACEAGYKIWHWGYTLSEWREKRKLQDILNGIQRWSDDWSVSPLLLLMLQLTYTRSNRYSRKWLPHHQTPSDIRCWCGLAGLVIWSTNILTDWPVYGLTGQWSVAVVCAAGQFVVVARCRSRRWRLSSCCFAIWWWLRAWRT